MRKTLNQRVLYSKAALSAAAALAVTALLAPEASAAERRSGRAVSGPAGPAPSLVGKAVSTAPLTLNPHVPQVTGPDILYDNVTTATFVSRLLENQGYPITSLGDDIALDAPGLINGVFVPYWSLPGGPANFDIFVEFFNTISSSTTLSDPIFLDPMGTLTIPVTGAAADTPDLIGVDISGSPGGGLNIADGEFAMRVTYRNTGTTTPVPNNSVTGWFNDAGMTVGFSADVAWLDFDSDGVFNVGDGFNFQTPNLASLGIYLEGVTSIPSASATWNVNADGNWTTGTNWTGGVAPNGSTAAATFGSVITAPRTVTLNDQVRVGTINFENANKYTIDGTGTILIGGTDARINQTIGSHDINVHLATLATTTITVANGTTLRITDIDDSGFGLTKAGAGTLILNRSIATDLRISAGTIQMIANGGNDGLSVINSLTMILNTTLDLNDNDMVVFDEFGMATIEQKVAAGRNGGLWNNRNITSTAARNNVQGNTGLGVISGADYISFNGGGGTAIFDGFEVIPTDTLIKYTYNGDANFNGVVNFDDYVRVDVGFNTNLTGWSNGDFNYSGVVNFDDYVLIDVAFNTQGGVLGRAVQYLTGEDRSTNGMGDPALQEVIEHYGQFGAPYANAFLAAVPEPATAGITALAGSVLAGARRRRRRR